MVRLFFALGCLISSFNLYASDASVTWTAVFDNIQPRDSDVTQQYCISHTPTVMVTTIDQITSQSGVKTLNGLTVKYHNYSSDIKDGLLFITVNANVSGVDEQGPWSQKMKLFEQSLSEEDEGVTWAVWSTASCKGSFIGTPTTGKMMKNSNEKMSPSISIITLGVDDLSSATTFYKKGLGLPYSSHSNDNVSFFDLNGAWLGLFQKEALAEGANVKNDGAGFSGVTLAHNVPSKEGVDRILKLAESAGAEITKPAKDTFWGGYSGYFSDVDGYLWEVAWNPHFTMNE